ncbi:MAG: alpha/beta hydrolase [Akkermansiaceae bacterium]|nr:alpha/beta hydrolase [Akkermansiaceae bacterium]
MRRRIVITALAMAAWAGAEEPVAPGREPGPGPSGAVDRWLTQMDRDEDGKLAKAEAAGMMARFFERNDADQSGFLEKDELAALARRLEERGGPARQRKPAGRQGGLSTSQLLKDAPDDVKVVPDLSYREGGSKRWKLDLIMPRENGDAPRPGIVFVHGGGWRSGDKRVRTFLDGAIDYARKGYVCITVNYRLTGEAPFPACVEDVKNAVRWFRAHAETYNLDPDRIGAYGNSAGAHLVAMLGLAGKEAGLEGDGPHQDQSSLVQAVCASATPTDFNLFGGGRSMNRPGAFLAGPEDGLEERIRLASPISHVREDAPPFLLVHGTKDSTVKVEHSDKFAAALKAAGAKDVTYLRIEGAGHGVFNQHKAKTAPAMETFFERTLGTAGR